MPMTYKFTLLSLGGNQDELSKSYSMAMMLVEMSRHLQWFGFQDVFLIVKTNYWHTITSDKACRINTSRSC